MPLIESLPFQKELSLWMRSEPPSCMHVAVPLRPAPLTEKFHMMQFIKPMLSAIFCFSANLLLCSRLIFPQLRRDSFWCNWEIWI